MSRWYEVFESGKVSRGKRLTSTAQARPIPIWTGPACVKMIFYYYFLAAIRTDPYRCVVVGRAKRNDDTPVPDGLLGVGFTRFSPVPYFPCLFAVTGAFPTCCLRLLPTSV